MQHIVVDWIHDFPDEPVHLYAELDDQRYEQRKVDVFRDGTVQTADAFHETGSTELGSVPHPSQHEIALDSQFRVKEITADEFERVWSQASRNQPTATVRWYTRIEPTTPVENDLQAIAERIDTGVADTYTSRALIVFNLTEQSLSGIAVFRAGMSWPADTPLPPVVISELAGEVVPSALTEWQEGPDRKGRADRRHLTFALRFVVRDVPPQGWRTYIAAYTSEAAPDAPEALADETPGLTVVETLRHTGDLPPTGQGLLSPPSS